MAARAGFAFIPGKWDWRAGKWEWVAGHWERERAGKKWREGRWENKDSKWTYTDGEWVDSNATTEPPPPPPAPPGTAPTEAPPGAPPGPPMPPGAGGEHHHREWKLERPVISNYWPAKGKAGSRIVIRGKNFPADAQVLFGGQVVTAAKITADRIVFEVPAGAASGAIELKAGRHPLAVGQFEVAAAYDPVAEQKKADDEARARAEAEWAERQKAMAKDKAARQAALQQRMQEMQTSREERRAKRAAEIQAKWEQAFLADPDTQDELTLHSQRLAQIQRMRDVAEVAANGKLVVRIGVASDRENKRHEERMAALQASFKARGGQP